MLAGFHYDFDALPAALDVLRRTLRLAVVFGGDKQHTGAVIHPTGNPRPWKSYASVGYDIQGALQELGFQHVSTFCDDMRLTEQLADSGTQLVWLNSGGVQGIDPLSHTPGLLEMLGLPYLGHSPLRAALLDNKEQCKHALQSIGIATARFVTWHPRQGAFSPRTSPRFGTIFAGYDGPFVVKPVSGRASLHVHVVPNRELLPAVVRDVYQATHNSVLVEQFLAGREFCVAIGGPVTSSSGRLVKHDAPFAFSVTERIFTPDEMIVTSMDEKPITSERARPVDDPILERQLVQIARTIYRELDLRALVRVDLRAGTDGTLHVLEVNPKPDLTRPTSHVTSLVSIGLERHGMSYHDLILSLLADRLDDLLTYEADVTPALTRLLPCCSTRPRQPEPLALDDNVPAGVLAPVLG